MSEPKPSEAVSASPIVVRRVVSMVKRYVSIWSLVIPLAIIGLTSALGIALLHIKQSGDWSYLAILLAVVTLGVIAITPLLRLWNRNANAPHKPCGTGDSQQSEASTK